MESMIEVDHLICTSCLLRFHLPSYCLAARGLWRAERLPERLLQLLHQAMAAKVQLRGVGRVTLSQVQKTIHRQQDPSHHEIGPGMHCDEVPQQRQRLPRRLPLLRDRHAPSRMRVQKYSWRDLVRRCRGCHDEILIKDYQEHINHCEKYMI